MPDKPVIDPADQTPAASDPADEESVLSTGQTPAASEPPDQESALSAGQIADLHRDRDDYRDRWVRKTAEFDNYRKRVGRERREYADQAIVDLLQQLLLIVDDFDLALRVDAGEAGGAYRKGVELIHAKLNDLMRKHRVMPIQALGADFDPNLHQAIIHEVSPEHREGEVIGELRRGYTMGDRLLRAAMVKVAKA